MKNICKKARFGWVGRLLLLLVGLLLGLTVLVGGALLALYRFDPYMMHAWKSTGRFRSGWGGTWC